MNGGGRRRFHPDDEVPLDDPEVQHEVMVYGLGKAIRDVSHPGCMKADHDQVWDAYCDLVPRREELRLESTGEAEREATRLIPTVEEAVAEANLRHYLSKPPPFVPLVADYDMLSADGLASYARRILGSMGSPAEVRVGRGRRDDRAIMQGHHDDHIMHVAAHGPRRPVTIDIPSTTRRTYSPKELKEAVLHEIAHVMVWPEIPFHHDRWQRAVNFIGGDPGLVAMTKREAPKSLFQCLCCGDVSRYYQFKLWPPKCSCGWRMKRVR